MNNIIFYKDNCADCLNLLNYINKNKKINEYHFISLDKKKNKKKYNYINKTPTLVVRDLKKSFVGDEALNYIKSKNLKDSYNIKLNKKDIINQQLMNYRNKEYKKDYIKEEKNKKINDFFFNNFL